jgi:hypothetical protein
LADITRVLVVVGPVDPLLLPPHAVDTNTTDIAIARRRCIDRSVSGTRGATSLHCAELRRKPSHSGDAQIVFSLQNFSGQL